MCGIVSSFLSFLHFPILLPFLCSISSYFYPFTQSVFYLYALAVSFPALLSFLSKNFFTPSSLFFVLAFLPFCLFYFDCFVSFFSNLHSQLSSLEHFRPVFSSFLFPLFFFYNPLFLCVIFISPLVKVFLVFIFFTGEQ